MNKEISCKKAIMAIMTRTRLRNRLRFWKPFVSNKVQSSERINLTEENNSLVTDCGEVANELKSFFSSVVKNLNISKV